MDFIPFTLIDLIDIVLVATIMYWIYRVTRGTNAPYIFSGIIAIYLLWVVVRALNMELLSSMLGQVISVGVIALIILFQPELRRFLQLIGLRQKHFNFISRIFSTTEEEQSTVNIEPIVTACRDMAETKTGALIGKNCKGAEKIERIREVIGEFEVRAMYTDDAKADGPLLAIAKERYIVTHGKVEKQ